MAYIFWTRSYSEENATDITEERKCLTGSNVSPEEITVIAVTEHGCVGESQMGQSVVVSDCSAGVGDVISAKFYAPASEQNGYYDRIYEKLAMVEP